MLLPTLQRRFELDAGGVARLVGIELVAASLTQPLLGALADPFGRTRVAAAGPAVGAVLLSTPRTLRWPEDRVTPSAPGTPSRPVLL